MKPPSGSVLLTRPRLLGLLGGVALVLLVCAIYWAHLLGDQSTRLRTTENQTRLRAVQMSATLASQVGTLVAGLEYLAHSLATTYEVDPERAFPLAVRTALQTFPGGSIVQVAVADASGRLTYSSLSDPQRPEVRTVFIADRAHFQAHAQHGFAQLTARGIAGQCG